MFQRCNSFLKIVSVGCNQLDESFQNMTRMSNRFGLELLVYSYKPTGLPTLVWAKVVDKEIWSRVRDGLQRKQMALAMSYRLNYSTRNRVVRTPSMYGQSSKFVDW